jgi:ribose 5-phosphate isomerase B
MNTYIVSDHAGAELKRLILKNNSQIINLNLENTPDDDFPDFADILAQKLKKEPNSMGIAICGSGQGICMAMNRNKWIRAGLVLNKNQVDKLRFHSNANVLCLSNEFTNRNDLNSIIELFLETECSTDEKYKRRIDKIS